MAILGCSLPTGIGLIYLIVTLIIIEGLNLLLLYFLSKYIDNQLIVSIITYLTHFFSLIAIYFAFCGFQLYTLMQAMILILGSIVIAIFLVIFFSPSYCNKDQNKGSQIGFYLEILLLAFLIYILIFFWSYFLYPYLSNSPPYANIRYDLIIMGIAFLVYLAILGLNTLSNSTTLATTENSVKWIGLIMFILKGLVILRQVITGKPLPPHEQQVSSSTPSIQSGSAYPEEGQWPDQQENYFRKKYKNKSSFYSFGS